MSLGSVGDWRERKREEERGRERKREEERGRRGAGAKFVWSGAGLSA